MTQGGYQVVISLPIKSKMAAAKKRCFSRFLYFTESSPPSTPRFTNDYEFAISVSQNSSRHSNLNFAHHFVMY